ncbi:MAG TPA: CopG family transcriptional regulator [Gemmatimonadaceae bacterium]|jgi:hypothetical protein|nr:CopG family transcriptional regulator [Gemmatimonadaceae bacterium]HET7622125.1 CopG family transcriptional regulator [Gemmatimonadaceae bacterium]
MKDTHLTLRLPLELARVLTRRARDRGVPKSLVAREAVALYLGTAPEAGAAPPLTARELAARWPELPRLGADDAATMERDIVEGRAALPAARDPWD